MSVNRYNGLVSTRDSGASPARRFGCSRLYKSGASKGCLVLPGATYDENWWFDLDVVSYEIREIVEDGTPVASIGTFATWGNSTQLTNVSNLKTAAQASLFASGKVHVLGVSAGGLTACNWAKNNPTLVQSLTLLIPVVDVQATYDNNRSGFQSSISAAYGGRPPNASNPRSYASDLSGIPIQVFYSTDDNVTTQAETLDFVSNSGATAYSMGAVGHFWGSPWSGQAVADFIAAH